MASTDATAIPIKNQAYRVTFPILDNDGDLVTGAAGLDSEISKDGGTFTDCTNEATEIATSSGIYYLDLSATEMNADTVAVIVKTSTSGAKTTALVFYPAEAGDIIVNVKQINGTTQTARDIGASVLLAADQAVNMTKIAGVTVSTSTAQLGVNVVNAGGTAWGSGAITAASIANGAIDNATFAADVGSTAYATNIIALAADKAIQNAALATAAELAKVPKSDSTVTWNATALGSIQTKCTDALNAYDPPTKAEMDSAFSTTNGKIDTIDDFLDTEIAAILADTNELQTDWANGGRLDVILDAASAPSAATVADAVWDEVLSGHAGAGSAGAALSAAGTAGDPWLTTLPGSYGAGTAGKIIGDNINAPIATVDTVVDGLATELAKVPKSDGTVSWNATALAAINAEVDTALNTAIPGSPTANSINERIATMDGLLLGTVAAGTHNPQSGDAYAIVNNGTYGNNALKTLIDTVDNFVDTEIGTLTTELAKVPKSDSTVTWNSTALASIQAECTDALNAYDPPTKAEMDSAFSTTNGKIDVVDGIVDDILVDTGTTLPGTLSTLSTAVSGVAAAVWNYLTAAMTTVGSIGKAFAAWLPGTAAGAPPYTASVVAICNNALMMLGNNAITALTDDTKAAKLCAQFYQLVLDSVLRAYTWNCATVRSAALTATTTPTFGFSYAFTLPTDCLRVLTIEDDATIPFKVESGVLLTDESTVMISYIQRIAPTSADGLLLEAVSARLAATIAFPLTNSTSAAEAMWKLYKDKLDEAQSIDAFEGTAPQMINDDWINSRS